MLGYKINMGHLRGFTLYEIIVKKYQTLIIFAEANFFITVHKQNWNKYAIWSIYKYIYIYIYIYMYHTIYCGDIECISLEDTFAWSLSQTSTP